MPTTMYMVERIIINGQGSRLKSRDINVAQKGLDGRILTVLNASEKWLRHSKTFWTKYLKQVICLNKINLPLPRSKWQQIEREKRKIIATGDVVRADLFYWDCLYVTLLLTIVVDRNIMWNSHNIMNYLNWKGRANRLNVNNRLTFHSWIMMNKKVGNDKFIDF